MDIRIQEADFDVAEELRALRAGRTDVGAIACFVGLVREFDAAQPLEGMWLEHYPGMTEKAIGVIVSQAMVRWRLLDVRVVHRVGRLAPADQIVCVATASMHREDAFAACDFVMDFLKTRAPLWKKEHRADGEQWVSQRARDRAAERRWGKGRASGDGGN